MDTGTLIGILAFGTMLAVLIFAYRSNIEMQKRMEEKPQKSTLAADAPNTTPSGVRPVDT